MTDERNGIGARVRALRERAGWSQLELAKRSGVRQNTLSDIETGQTPSPQGFPPQIEEHPDRIRVWAQPATNRPVGRETWVVIVRRDATADELRELLVRLASSDTRPPWPYTPRVALSADSPVSLVLAARTLPETRAEALAELRRRLTLAGPSCASPGALSAAVGIGERTLRRVLDELDAEGPAVPVGWTRSRGGGMVRARAGRARKIAANPRT